MAKMATHDADMAKKSMSMVGLVMAAPRRNSEVKASVT